MLELVHFLEVRDVGIALLQTDCRRKEIMNAWNEVQNKFTYAYFRSIFSPELKMHKLPI
jgi:hypothetical protein